MPNGKKEYREEFERKFKYAPFWDWLKENYPDTYATLSVGKTLLGYQYDPRTGEYTPQYQAVDPYTSEIFKWWQAYEAPYTVGGLPRPPDRPSPQEYKEGVAGIFRQFVNRGEWTEAQARAKIGQLDYWLDTYGLSPQIPYYDAVIHARKRVAGLLPDLETLFAKPPMPAGERQVSPFEGITTGALRFGITGAGAKELRQQARYRDISREQGAVAKTLEALPSARPMLTGMLKGASPAMQAYFRSEFPYIFEEFGGEARRQAWAETQARAQAEAARLGEKRRGLQWVAGKKKEYLPVARGEGMGGFAYPYGQEPVGATQTFAESYQDTLRRIASIGRREQAIRGKPKAIDPWATFLANYPFMEKFITVPPAERGFFPARFSPFTRWI